MIQRIQTIYLAIAVICSIALFFVPVLKFDVVNQTGTIESITMKTTGLFTVAANTEVIKESYSIEMGLLTLVIVLATLNIFMFKNRVLQMKLCWAGALASLVMAILMMKKADPSLYGENIQNWSAQIGSYIYSIIIIVQIFALRAIRKDELLVRSSDRLR